MEVDIDLVITFQEKQAQIDLSDYYWHFFYRRLLTNEIKHFQIRKHYKYMYIWKTAVSKIQLLLLMLESLNH